MNTTPCPQPPGEPFDNKPRLSAPITDALIDKHGQEQFYGGTEENISRIVWGHYQELQKHARTLERENNQLRTELEQCRRELKEALELSQVLDKYHNNPEWIKHYVKGRDYSFPEFVDNIIAERDRLHSELEQCRKEER